MDSGTRWAKHDSRFGKLAKQLDMELESAVMQRVFNEIDEEHSARVDVGTWGSGKVSVRVAVAMWSRL